MEDLTRLGNRTIFFFKGFFLSLLSMAVMFGIISGLFGNLFTMADDFASMSMGFLALSLLFLFSSLFMLFFCLIGTIHYFVWVFRVTKNLRRKSKTVLSPWVSVISLIIWYVNIFIQFGIMRNLIHVQEKQLQEAGIIMKPVQMKFLVLNFVLNILAMLFSINSSSAVLFMLSLVSVMASIVFFIKVMEPFIAQHTALYKFEQDQIFQKRVDEAIREREIERLAQEVQQAKYE